MSTNFGKDVSCMDSLRTGRLVTGARLVGEAIYRRLTTPRGTLIGGEEEADYGIDLTALVGTTSPTNAAAAMRGRISVEVQKDERIHDVDVSVIANTSGALVSFAITIAATTAAGPFELQMTVDKLTVALVGLKVDE